MSRKIDWAEGVERDNKNQVILKKEWLVKIVEKMKKAGVKTLREEEWQIEEELVLKEGRVYVPKDEKLRVEIIRLYHDTPIAGHGRQWKTVELVIRNYWWPGVTKEVKRYDQCQRIKNRAEMPAVKLRPNQVPKRLWQHISVDFITKLPVSKGHDSILVVCNRFPKMLHFVVTTEKTTAKGLARLFRDNI